MCLLEQAGFCCLGWLCTSWRHLHHHSFSRWWNIQDAFFLLNPQKHFHSIYNRFSYSWIYLLIYLLTFVRPTSILVVLWGSCVDKHKATATNWDGHSRTRAADVKAHHTLPFCSGSCRVYKCPLHNLRKCRVSLICVLKLCSFWWFLCMILKHQPLFLKRACGELHDEKSARQHLFRHEMEYSWSGGHT